MDRSDRRSVRVDSAATIRAGQQPAGLASAPESMASARGPTASAPEGMRRLSQEQVDRLAAGLSDRDRAVLSDLQRYGFMTTTQIQTLHFHNYDKPEVSARITRRDLQRLRSQRLLEPLQRRIGGLRAGSQSYVWQLGLVGDRVLRDPSAPRARRKEPSLRFLQHRLAVVGTICQLTLAARAGSFELLDVQSEPGTWRTFPSGYGGSEILKPDLSAVTASGDYEDHWYIEVDRATESLPTVLKQCEQYERYQRAGIEQDRLGIFPRVLWLVPDEHRRVRLQLAISERRALDEALFDVELHERAVDLITQLTTKGGD